MLRRSFPLLAGFATAGATAAGLAYAAPGDAPVIRACADKSSGVLRLATSDQPCDPDRTTTVSWNEAGPAGPAGSAGPAGPAGARGEDTPLATLALDRLAGGDVAAPAGFLAATPTARPRLRVRRGSRALVVRKSAQQDIAAYDDASGYTAVLALTVPRGRWLVTAKTTAAPRTGVDYFKPAAGSAFCALNAGETRDFGRAHRGDLTATLAHRFAGTGVIEIRCVGTPDTHVMQSSITAVKVDSLRRTTL